MDTIPLPTDFKECLQYLNARNVEYLLIGGFAVAYHGYPRATGDMDIWIAMSRTNAERVVDALTDFGFTPAITGRTSEVFLKPNQLVRMGNPPLRIEIHTSISGVEFDECYSRRDHAVLDSIPIGVISKEDLKTNKTASGRSKDRSDLDNLP
jgi:phage replication-related protein YjqB (UPF0714/DUF867 family)